MKRLSVITMGLLVVTGLAVSGCSTQMSGQGDAGWITLLDGSNPKTLDNWNRIGDANWRVEDGAIVADKGKGGYLVSKNSYKDFQIRAEFWADHTTNSGIFIRITDPEEDQRQERLRGEHLRPAAGPGVRHRRPSSTSPRYRPMPKAGGKWNTYEITAKGSQLMVDAQWREDRRMQDSQFAEGRSRCSSATGDKGAPGGAIKWRKVQIRPL